MNNKAKNLAILSKIHGINVPQFVVLQPKISKSEQTKIICNFLKNYGGTTVAVRSSAEQEDSIEASFAGMFTTKLRVKANLQEIQKAVAEVQSSRKQKNDVVTHYTQHHKLKLTYSSMAVIIQEMIEAEMSGVIFSHGLMKDDHYYVVSVSDGIGENIVGGAINGKLIRVVRGIELNSIKNIWLRKLIAAMRTIEQHFQSTNLDVEFAIRKDILYILQCRPITTTKTKTQKNSEKQLLRKIKLTSELIESRFRGDVLGDMIDINPIELLGMSPTPLDISVFNYLFADRIVEQARQKMGYNPLNIGLIRVIAGKPYVSMRASAYSFRPNGISDKVYEQIIHIYRNILIKNPELQNRVEFNVFAMRRGERLEWIMREAQLNNNEKTTVREAFDYLDTVISQISRKQIKNFDAFADNYKKYTKLLEQDNISTDEILQHVARGTEMFTCIARLAFYWKNKFEELYPKENLNALMYGHIRSINEQLQLDLAAYYNGLITRGEIIQRYGHLRPGQFSVFGESYADDPDTYLFTQITQMKTKTIQIKNQVHAFENKEEFKYVTFFMQAREHMKFLFSQSFDLFVKKLKRQLNKREKISKYHASRLDWNNLRLYLNGSTALNIKHTKNKPLILLPNVIIPGITDLRIITFNKAMPTYITKSVIKARLCIVENLKIKASLKGALVLLPNADPGYDFIFHSGAVGIITKVGGPASHMCIRSIELQMPACIGCGENVYQKLKRTASAILDCQAQQIIILK